MNERYQAQRYYTIASIGLRSTAFLIDWIIRSSLAIFLFLLLNFADTGRMVPYQLSEISWLAVALALTTYSLYHLILEVCSGGETIGKRMVGIQVVNVNGEQASRQQLIVRNIFRLIDGFPGNYALGILVTLFNEKQLRLGDIVSGTQLVVNFEKEGTQTSTVNQPCLNKTA